MERRPHPRVSDESEFLDANDRPLSLPADARVVLVHPALLAPAELSTWGQVFLTMA